MKWINIEEKLPEDDHTVFIINSGIEMLPVKAYYCQDSNEFITLESMVAIPVSTTH